MGASSELFLANVELSLFNKTIFIAVFKEEQSNFYVSYILILLFGFVPVGADDCYF